MNAANLAAMFQPVSIDRGVQLPTSSSTVSSLMTAGSPFFVVTDLTVSYIVGMVVMDMNSEIYTSMASSLLTFITICRLSMLKSQMEFLIQIRFCGVVTERVAILFRIVAHTLPTSSSTVNSLMTAGSPFFAVTDLTVSYVVGVIVMDRIHEI